MNGFICKEAHVNESGILWQWTIVPVISICYGGDDDDGDSFLRC